MIHPVVINPVINPVVRITDPVAWRAGKAGFPSGAILHFDANIDAFSEQTGGPHTFSHAILSPQYQRNADGSYTDVGAKPAVDVFDGEKWLRSCGAVTNLLPSGTVFSGITYSQASFVNGKIVPNTANSEHYGILPAYAGFANGAFYTLTCEVKESEYSKVRLSFHSAIASSDDRHAHFDLVASSIITKGANVSATIVKNANGTSTLTITRASTATASSVVGYIAPLDASGNVVLTGDGVGGFFAYTLMLTATSYPVPYTPPGTTMPASNATATNGMWFTLPDGSPMWHALDGGPETDGVELVDLTSAIVQNAGGSIGSYDGETKTLSNTGIGTNGSYPRFSFEMGAKTVGARYRCSFVFSDAARVHGVRLGGYTQSLTKTGNVFSGTITADNTYNKAEILLDGRFIFSTQIISATIQRIQPQPLTLATRVRMGVGSGDLPNSTNADVASVNSTAAFTMQFYRKGTTGANAIAMSSDGTNTTDETGSMLYAWARGAIVRRATQVNTAGTQFRIGYLVEGVHTTIQWSPWAAFDGSFGPSTLYRLMLGYNNAYPMWFSRITAWKEQVSDDRILEALNG